MKFQLIQKYSVRSLLIHFQTFNKSLSLHQQVGASVTSNVASISHAVASRNKLQKILTSTSVACQRKFWCTKVCACLRTYRASILILLIYAWNLLSACSTSVFQPILNLVGTLAQPFRYLAHNGEINTIEGNRQWARARAYKFRHRHCCQIFKLQHHL